MLKQLDRSLSISMRDSYAAFDCRWKSRASNVTVEYLSFFVRSNPYKLNEAILAFGDSHGQVNALLFSAATMALFDRPSQPAGSKQGEQTLNNYWMKFL